MIVTIDGPAGAGKSSVARALAARLGFQFLDTGAMYRTVALAAVEREHDWNDAQALVHLAREIDIRLEEERVYLDGRDVSDAIRTLDITSVTHYAANNPGVREALVELQKLAAGDDDLVTEGRDQGTVVFPHAECKIFLTASPEARARRRALEMESRGEPVDFAEVLTRQNERDASDASRAVGPLKAADDSIEVVTDDLSPQEVVDRLEEVVRARDAQLRSAARQS